MEMMGMSSNMYWMSWFITHWSTAMVTVLLMVLIGIYPFEYTSPVMQLIFYSLWVTSCILWNYMVSTVFSRSITASVGRGSNRLLVGDSLIDFVCVWCDKKALDVKHVH